MNVVYHRNCLDGTYSSYLMNLINRVIGPQELEEFIQTIFENKLSEVNLKDLPSRKATNSKKVIINEDFFHVPSQLNFNAYSFFAGEFHPLKFPNQQKVLFILDTNLATV